MRTFKTGLCACAVVVGLCLTTTAHAHLMPENRGTVNVVGERVYMVVSWPVETFLPHVEEGSIEQGMMTAETLRAQQDEMRDAITQHVKLSSGMHAAEFDTIMLNLPTGYDHDPEKSSELIVMAAASFPSPPQPLTLTSSLWAEDAAPLELKASVSAGRDTLREELGTLTPEHPTYTFFAGPIWPDLATLLPLLPGAPYIKALVHVLSVML